MLDRAYSSNTGSAPAHDSLVIPMLNFGWLLLQMLPWTVLFCRVVRIFQLIKEMDVAFTFKVSDTVHLGSKLV